MLPSRFSERLSAYLWATHQIDDFSTAAEDYIQVFNTAVPEAAAPAPRLGIAVIGQEISQTNYPLFRKLRPHGVYFSHVDPKSSYKLLLDTVAERSQAHPSPYAHWCIDGGLQTTPQSNAIARSYGSLQPVRKALIRKMQQVSASQAGAEALRTRLAETDPAEVGMKHQRRRSCSEPFRHQRAYGRLGNPDLQHDFCAMDCPGGPPPGAAADHTGEIRAPANRRICG